MLSIRKAMTMFSMRNAVAALFLVFVVSACGSSSNSSKGKQYRIGAFALVPFTQLQDMMTGFKQSATNCGLVEGKNTTYFVDFAQGQESTLQLLGKRDLENHVDLFVALDTPSMTTMAGLSKTVPIVAVAPTYPTQSGVVQSFEHPGGNVTGGTDYIDPTVTVATIQEALPQAKTVGIIYNPSEQNSASFEKAIRPALAAKGLKLHEVSITNTGEIQSAARGLVSRVDVILLGPDNTAISAAPTVAQVATANKIPFVSYVSGVAAKGALLDLGVSYLFLGQQAGKQACDILKNGADPANMPFTKIKSPTLTVNTDTEKALGITLPGAVLQQAVKVTTGTS
jgi:putative tryptophan/tyrosine transport system substrate-binding protein